MKRTRVACLLLAAVLATIGVAGGVTITFKDSGPKSVEEALNIPQTPLKQRLYSGGFDPETGVRVSAIESAVEIDSPHARFLTYWDGSTEDVMLKPGIDVVLSSQSYYAIQPNEEGRRPHVARLFNDKGDIVDEKVLRLNGSLLQTTVLAPDLSKLIVDFAEDGSTRVREQQFAAPKCCDSPVLLRDQRWRDDDEHSLAYSNVYNADETRTIKDFDAHNNVLKEVYWPQYQSINGATVKAFYPGSLKPRLDALGDYYKMAAKYFREDGTLEAQVNISPTTVEIYYYDATGTKPRLYQMWFIQGDWKNAIAADATYRLYVVTEYDDNGEKTRSVSFSDGKVQREERYNVVEDGIHFVEVDYSYKDNALVDTRYWLNEVVYPPYKLVTTEPGLKIAPNPVTPENMRFHITVDAGLPRPAPQRGGGY